MVSGTFFLCSLTQWAGIGLLLYNALQFKYSYLILMKAILPLLAVLHISSFIACHSISGHLFTLAVCAWPFRSVITVHLFTAFTKHCIDHLHKVKFKQWRDLSTAFAQIRFIPTWLKNKNDIIAIICLKMICHIWSF